MITAALQIRIAATSKDKSLAFLLISFKMHNTKAVTHGQLRNEQKPHTHTHTHTHTSAHRPDLLHCVLAAFFLLWSSASPDIPGGKQCLIGSLEGKPAGLRILTTRINNHSYIFIPACTHLHTHACLAVIVGSLIDFINSLSH